MTRVDQEIVADKAAASVKAAAGTVADSAPTAIAGKKRGRNKGLVSSGRGGMAARGGGAAGTRSLLPGPAVVSGDGEEEKEEEEGREEGGREERGREERGREDDDI